MKIIPKLVRSTITIVFWVLFTLVSMNCSNKEINTSDKVNILFLHHSTGNVIWKGNSKSIDLKGFRIGAENAVPDWFDKYNKLEGTSYNIAEQYFPKESPYGWNNYPYDYYNIWVKNAGSQAYMEEPTLEMLTRDYQVIIFKHCYPVTDLKSDSVNIDVNSSEKTIENYKLQYEALKQKLLSFPNNKFIIWTGAARVKSQSSEASANYAKSFFDWVRNTWDTENDNIFLWDFYELETEGSLYLKTEYASSMDNSHPNKVFAQQIVPYFCRRIIDVIENNGSKTTLTGKYK